MELYTAQAAVQFGPGETLSLDKRQLDMRTGQVERTGDDGGRTKVRALQLITFKAGEIIGLAVPIAKNLVDKVAPVNPPAVEEGAAAVPARHQGKAARHQGKAA